jgi:hypothetical protein
LEKIAGARKITKSQLIREAIDEYLVSREKEVTLFMVGENFFGRYGSGKGDLSTTYKNILKDKLNAKGSR